MIKFEIEGTGKKRKSDGAREMLVKCEMEGKGIEIATEIKHFLEIMNENAHEPLMMALEHFMENEIAKFDDEDEDDEE